MADKTEPDKFAHLKKKTSGPADAKPTAARYFLHEAVQKNDFKNARRLLDHGTCKIIDQDDVRAACSSEPLGARTTPQLTWHVACPQMGWTPLIIAVQSRLYDMVRVLHEEYRAPLDPVNNVRHALGWLD